MAAFEYKALDAKGKQKKGIIEADTSRQARSQLKEQGLMPLSLSETSARAKPKESSSSDSGFKLELGFKTRVSTADLALLTRQLATLVGAGMPIEECLKAVAQQVEKDKLSSMMMSVRSRVVEGYSLAEALADYPHVFDQLFVAMVASGEKSGHLEVVLNRLADYTERRQAMKSTITQAMVYPAMLTIVAVSVVAFLLATVVPDVVGQFMHMGQDLPQITQVMIALSDFILDWGLLFLVLMLIAMVTINRLLMKPEIRLAWDARKLKLPVIGKVSSSLETSRFAHTLSILTASAVPLLEAMQIASQVLANTKAKELVKDATARVREGTSLRAALLDTGLFPPMMIYMVASGEKSGELEQMLGRAADNQDKQFEAQVQIALGIFQPVLVLIMAGMVLSIVMAILLPIIELNNLMN
ncbi:type II secretion system inner membrane protein GspF [Paraferrimonas sp. SM1919]|uniref:type II secretion system inner membrane protein GspF n=1 Tax=Paraferrimonas sp. SM1919 TaxID=2662263 RepID=UPI0013D15F27|nr:type II secretion system inner membrane protein GspF [Paraferrimonas sp. SM1919]